MKVRVVSSQKQSFWYADKVGQEFYVTDHDYRSYKIYPDGYYIRIVDCEIMSHTEIGVSEMIIPQHIINIINRLISIIK